jgi:predicted Holliday junction resolvase-like endonuclease
MKDFMNAITMVLEGKTVEVQQLDEKLTPKQQKLDLHEPEKDELTAKDFEMLRAKAKLKEKAEIDEEVEELNEALRKVSEHGKGTGTYHAEVRYNPE